MARLVILLCIYTLFNCIVSCNNEENKKFESSAKVMRADSCSIKILITDSLSNEEKIIKNLFATACFQTYFYDCKIGIKDSLVVSGNFSFFDEQVYTAGFTINKFAVYLQKAIPVRKRLNPLPHHHYIKFDKQKPLFVKLGYPIAGSHLWCKIGPDNQLLDIDCFMD
jgi:hypothetical protein